MTVQQAESMECRVLCVAHDTARMDALTAEHGLEIAPCSTQSILDELERGAGVLIIERDLLTPDLTDRLAQWRARQPSWSDLPVVVLGVDVSSDLDDTTRQALGRPITLGHEVSPDSLRAVITAALAGREQQYRLRRVLRERAEAMMNEKRFRSALRGARIIITNQDRNLRYTWAYNPQDESTIELLNGKDDYELFGPEVGRMLEEYKRRVMETGESERQELHLWHMDRPWWWQLNIDPLRDESNQIIGVTCTSLDITEQRFHEEATTFLARAVGALADDLTFSTAMRKLAEVAVEAFADWCIIDLRESEGVWKRLVVTHRDPTKTELAELLRSRTVPNVHTPDHPYTQVLATGRPQRVNDITDEMIRQRLPDEMQRRIVREMNPRSAIIMPITVRNEPIGVIVFTSCERQYTQADVNMVSDLARHAARAVENDRLYTALCASEQRYRLAARATTDAIWEWDLTNDTMEWSERFGTLFGHELSRIIPTGEWWKNHIHPDDRKHVLDRLRQALELGQDTWTDEYRFRCGDGSYVYVLDRGTVVRDESGKPIRMVGAMLDLTEIKRGQEALRLSEERFRLAARATNDVIWDWDLASDHIEWNESITTVFGYSPESVPRTSAQFGEAVHPDDRERVLKTVDMILTSGEEHIVDEYRFRRANGTYAVVLDRSFVVRDSRGRPVRMIGAMLDVSDRKRVEESLRDSVARFVAVAQALPQMVWTANPDGFVDFLNERWSQFTGLAEEASRGWAWLDVIHPEDQQRTLETFRQSMATGELYQIEHRIRAADGTYRWHLSRAMPMRDHDGRIIKWIGTATEIHDRKIFEESLKRSEEELKRLNETLEQRVAERTAVAEQRATQLRVLASELTSTEQRERRRLANILHDHLQQLLVAATMKIGILRSRVPSPEGKQILQQIKDLLNQSIASSRSLTVELSPPVLYDAGLAAALNWLAGWMEEKHGLKVEVKTDPDAEPLAEDVRAFFFQAVRELLFNVVKHADTDTARVEVAVDEARQLRITVEDDGRGVSPEALERMDSGEGFGLFNIRERLELLGGQLHVENRPEGGTRISMLAPRDQLVQAAEELQVAAPERTSGSVAPKRDRRSYGPNVTRVLLADDHQIVREGLMGLIQEQPDIAVIGEACDGQMAVEMARELKPDVVIMDVSMPQLNGIEATRRILAELPSVRVIGLSMHERETMAAAMRAAGAAAYLPKGGPSEPLIAAIRGARVDTPSGQPETTNSPNAESISE